MNLACMLKGGTAPEESDVLGEQTAARGAAGGSVYPTGNQLPRSSDFWGAGPRTSSGISPSFCLPASGLQMPDLGHYCKEPQ